MLWRRKRDEDEDLDIFDDDDDDEEEQKLTDRAVCTAEKAMVLSVISLVCSVLCLVLKATL